MFKLLPHRFKKIGLIIAPTGLLLWSIMQIGLISEFSEFIGISNPKILNVSSAILGFYSFLFGIYALSFSKEKIEDEMIKNIRLQSFQFAAFIQIVFLIIGLTWIGFMKNPPEESGLVLFFILEIFIFWIVYMIRFNYVLHIDIYKYEK